MTATTPKRQLYRGAYQATLDEPDTLEEPVESKTSENQDPEHPEEKVWKKRYGDLRSYNNTLTEEVKSLKSQLAAATKKEIKIPSSKEEIEDFARRYPDIFRHIKSIAMIEVLQERQDISQETKAVKDNLATLERELGLKKILQAHPDFETLNDSDDFHTWAQAQPEAIKAWIYDSTDPNLCIKALDMYKAEKKFVEGQSKPRKPSGADQMVNVRSSVEPPTEQGNKKIWKASEIGKLHPKLYEKYEAEIEKAREEGRIDFAA